MQFKQIPPLVLKIEDEKKKNILKKVPITDNETQTFINPGKYCQVLGTPSSLTRYQGNPHSALTKLREAAYWHMGVRTPVNEEIPYFDNET